MKTLFYLSIFLMFSGESVIAQISSSSLSGQETPVTSAVPFLGINGDARSSGMGEISAVSNSPNQPFHLIINPSLLAKEGMSVSNYFNYTPWLNALVDGINLYDLGVKFSFKRNTFTYNFRYFSLGNIQFTNINGENTGEFEPNEMVQQIRYARLLSKHFAIGAGFKYIYSNLATGQTVNGIDLEAGKSVAGDIGFDYRDEFKFGNNSYLLNIGTDIQNLGSKITYTDSDEKDFIPTTWNLGIMNSYKITFSTDSGSRDSYVLVNLGYQTHKLMVPTPSDIDDDNNGIPDYREKSVMSGVFGSFSDAPGGASEELHDLFIISAGALRRFFFNSFLW